jgi:hypothetical protein
MVPVTLTGGWYGTFLGEPGAPKPKLPLEATVNFGLQMEAITPELRAKYHLAPQQQGWWSLVSGSVARRRMIRSMRER